MWLFYLSGLPDSRLVLVEHRADLLQLRLGQRLHLNNGVRSVLYRGGPDVHLLPHAWSARHDSVPGIALGREHFSHSLWRKHSKQDQLMKIRIPSAIF